MAEGKNGRKATKAPKTSPRWCSCGHKIGKGVSVEAHEAGIHHKGRVSRRRHAK
jgi:hypothetical protein